MALQVACARMHVHAARMQRPVRAVQAARTHSACELLAKTCSRTWTCSRFWLARIIAALGEASACRSHATYILARLMEAIAASSYGCFSCYCTPSSLSVILSSAYGAFSNPRIRESQRSGLKGPFLLSNNATIKPDVAADRIDGRSCRSLRTVLRDSRMTGGDVIPH